MLTLPDESGGEPFGATQEQWETRNKKNGFTNHRWKHAMFIRALTRRLGLTRTPEARRAVLRRPSLEALEDRIVLNNRFVVPYELPADDATTFHALSRALTKAGLAPGDVIQIEPNSAPGAITDSNLPSVTNLTIRGH